MSSDQSNIYRDFELSLRAMTPAERDEFLELYLDDLKDDVSKMGKLSFTAFLERVQVWIKMFFAGPDKADPAFVDDYRKTQLVLYYLVGDDSLDLPHIRKWRAERRRAKLLNVQHALGGLPAVPLPERPPNPSIEDLIQYYLNEVNILRELQQEFAEETGSPEEEAEVED